MWSCVADVSETLGVFPVRLAVAHPVDAQTAVAEVASKNTAVFDHLPTGT